MKFKNILLLFFLLSLCANGVVAQTTLLPKQINSNLAGIIYKSEWAVDVRLHTNGAALALNLGKIKTYYKTSYYHFELGYLKDPRERKQTKPVVGLRQSAGSYVFGKQNSVFVLRGGYGVKRYLSEKEKRKGLAIGWNYEIGPSIALLKPYYLDLSYEYEGQNGVIYEIRSERYSEENAETFLNDIKIFGSSGFFNGFNELGVVPGLQGKLGLHFAMGAFDKYVKAFEVGMMFDAYIKKIPIMVETENVSNKPYFVNLYLNLHFGKRSN